MSHMALPVALRNIPPTLGRHPIGGSKHTQLGVASAGWIFAWVVLLVVLVGVATPVGLIIWEATSPSAAIQTSDAGAFVSSTSSPGGYFAPTLSSVQTTAGTITVVGTFSALRGSALAVQQMNKVTTLQLCIVEAPSSCAPLAGAWAGPMTPTPEAGHVVAFERYGLATGNLEAWIVFGVLALLIVGLSGIIALGDADDEAGEQVSVPKLPEATKRTPL